MNEFIRKTLSSKKVRAFIGVVVVLGIAIGAYTVIAVRSNLNYMAEYAKEDSTAVPYFPDYPAVNTAGRDAGTVARGEYLAKAGDCLACHTNTPKKGTQFAGGLPMPTPFGVIYTPNITPDKETGIGGWTDEQFIKAMRDGVSPGGHFYYPAFPYYYFSQISTDDLKALKAYLDSIPAVHQVNTENTMVKPFNIRLLQEGWRLLFFHPKTNDGYKQDTTETAEWNRGAYLVEGLGHCAMCHTPSYYLLTPAVSLGAPIEKYNLTGAPVQGYLAPNICKSNLETISNQDIIDVFKKDMLIGGGNVVGPMLEVNHDSLKYLTDADLQAIAVYLKSVKSKTPPKPKSSGGPGASIYDSYCSACHATGAGGAPQFGNAQVWEALVKSNGQENIYEHAIHGLNGMPAKGTCITCTDDQIKQAVDYMEKGDAAGAAPPPSVVVPQMTMEDGKVIYEKNCSSCHAQGVNGAPKVGDMAAWESIVNNGFMNAYENILLGRNGHQPNGACPTCTDADLKAALKYMLQTSSTNNYSLW